MNIVSIRRMMMDDLDEVVRIDRNSFSLPWSKNNFIFELTENQTSRSYVAFIDKKLVGLIVIWLIVDEVQIATIAVDEDYRRLGVADALLRFALEKTSQEGAKSATLEVRVSNVSAQKLYSKAGFEVVANRPNYYSDTKEGALIMTLNDIGALVGF